MKKLNKARRPVRRRRALNVSLSVLLLSIGAAALAAGLYVLKKFERPTTTGYIAMVYAVEVVSTANGLTLNWPADDQYIDEWLADVRARRGANVSAVLMVGDGSLEALRRKRLMWPVRVVVTIDGGELGLMELLESTIREAIAADASLVRRDIARLIRNGDETGKYPVSTLHEMWPIGSAGDPPYEIVWPHVGWYASWIALIVLSAACAPLLFVTTRRAMRRCHATNALCPRCLYDVSANHPETCPECGQRINWPAAQAEVSA